MYKEKTYLHAFSLTSAPRKPNLKSVKLFVPEYVKMGFSPNMKKVFPIALVALFLSLGVVAQAAERVAWGDEYSLQAYTLSNGSPVTIKASSENDTIGKNNLYIFSDAMDTVLNRDEDLFRKSRAGINAIPFQGVVIQAAYAPLSNITIHSSIGLSNTSADETLDYTDRLGWELDLGVAYKFLNKFAYEVHFGYMDTGELFTESNKYTDLKNITIVTNKLTMSF